MRHLQALGLLCLLPTAALASPQYCASGGTVTCPNPFGGFISNVTIGSLNNASACVPSPGYEDYTALPGPTLPHLVATPITVTVTGSVASNMIGVFCDWNRNFVFDVDEQYILPPAPSGVFTGVITPPSGAVPTTLMRIKLHWRAFGPCGAFEDGNTEDYTVHTSASLHGVPMAIHAVAGGVHTLSLDASPARAFHTYIVAGSMTGKSPGFQVAGLTVPLNFDFYTNLILTNPNVPPFVNTFGTLDALGQAVASIRIPPRLPFTSSLVLHHAFVALDGSGSFVFASEAEALTILR